MPHATARLSVADAVDHIRARSFMPSAPCRVGVELEWLTIAENDADARGDPATLRRVLPPALPADSTVTFEPGGQLEISSPPSATAGEACAAAAVDLAVARSAAARAGVRLVGMGADPHRPPRRMVHTPRYAAMEAHFDGEGPSGRRMMCDTPAVQVNVGMGPTAADAERQWQVASAVGPTLAAAFANSPLVDGRPSGFRSSRMAWWWGMDRSRARPVQSPSPVADAWPAYVLDARLMFIRTGAGPFEVPPRPPPTFRDWLTFGHRLGWPTSGDLDYHLTTLLPPVRPKGWWELRMVDALPEPWWRVPVAVAAALLLDAEAGEAARRAAEVAGVTDAWPDASRLGMAAPALAASARACFKAAARSFPMGDLVAAYAERWVERGRTPADDTLDGWRAGDRTRPFEQEASVWT